MSPETVLAMRKAAALAFAVPGLEVDISCGGDLIARVQRRFDWSRLSPTTTLLAPCAFRSAVGRLIADGTSDRALFLGLDPDDGLQIDYFMPFTGAVRPLGLVVSRVAETVVHTFATPRSISDVRAAIASIGYHPSIPTDIVVNCARDTSTQITLVYTEGRIGDMLRVRPYLDALMETVLLRIAVDEIIDAVVELTARSTGPS